MNDKSKESSVEQFKNANRTFREEMKKIKGDFSRDTKQIGAKFKSENKQIFSDFKDSKQKEKKIFTEKQKIHNIAQTQVFQTQKVNEGPRSNESASNKQAQTKKKPTAKRSGFITLLEAVWVMVMSLPLVGMTILALLLLIFLGWEFLKSLF